MRTEFPVTDEGIKRLKIQVLRELSATPYPREALPTIAMKHKLTVDDARALVERHGWPDAGAMGRAAEVLDGNARPSVIVNGAPATAMVTSTTQPNRANGTEQMIAAAEKSTKARTRRLATRVRKDLAELQGLVVAERKEAEAARVKAEETARLKAEVAELELELAQKKAALRPAPRPKPDKPDKPAKPRRNDSKKIRAWAVEHGVDCAAAGRLPAEVVEAYDRAHPSEGDS